ncbi:hypothetical protein FJ651_11030 [Paucihalobacter ruber]|uniref:Uncharacterized protein n=1 Tax=Paucihalobacter ruber TaxID=2567861 RepID=A0A506PHF6_9FLAO|nr:hypothetical protein [Paucihalobacter ruber]TPV32835.1 hypothetical protein FJ651_11030 [Paucihalobacter ruber]
MKTFPAAQTILLIIAAFVALLTWIIPAGQNDELRYDKTESIFIEKMSFCHSDRAQRGGISFKDFSLSFEMTKD